jgi:hypothetical protein
VRWQSLVPNCADGWDHRGLRRLDHSNSPGLRRWWARRCGSLVWLGTPDADGSSRSGRGAPRLCCQVVKGVKADALIKRVGRVAIAR